MMAKLQNYTQRHIIKFRALDVHATQSHNETTGSFRLSLTTHRPLSHSGPYHRKGMGGPTGHRRDHWGKYSTPQHSSHCFLISFVILPILSYHGCLEPTPVII